MKKTLLMLLISAAGFSTIAQTNTFPSTGNVGIGTTSPSTPLHIVKAYASLTNIPMQEWDPSITGYNLVFSNFNSTAGIDYRFTQFNAGTSYPVLTFQAGNVGIGTTSPGMPLDVKGVIRSTTGGLQIGKFGIAANPQLSIGIDNNAFASSAIINGWGNSSNPGISIGTTRSDGVAFSVVTGVTLDSNWLPSSSGTTALTVLGGGNVCIGTINPQGYLLAVNGSAIATSMTVKLYANWPDYVFKKDYQLPTLSEIKSYIDQNHHLPDMPSEQQVAKDGINLGEMNKLLTKKVEELTLYLIENAKELAEQKKINAIQDERLKELEQQIELINKKLR